MKRLTNYTGVGLLYASLCGSLLVGCDAPSGQSTAVVRENREPAARVRPAQKPARPAPVTRNGATAIPVPPADTVNPEQTAPEPEGELANPEQPEIAAEWDTEREELRKSIKTEIESIETKIDELKGEIDGAGPDVRTRCQRAISELHFERAKLNNQLKRLSAANKDNWEKLKNRISNAVQATDERVSQVSDQVSR